VKGRIALLLSCVLAACADGYPSGNEPGGLKTPQDRVEVLQKLVRDAETQVRTLSLNSPCVLTVQWKDHGAIKYDVLRLDTVVDTDPTSRHFVVFLEHAGEAASPLFLSTPVWAEMTIARTQVNQLRADCAEWRQPRQD